ncbi:2'-5' RNA ligase family protein [Sphingomonas kyeonggiensis]|uniref:2'-5' RNA ligase n=1 Tax=Sphingomonas kyeonggiensis TaxID=1268553 RepID=A0A7W6JU74_9SPHN|nr:2'-5' RNA ligase family protein [Sphingomonas kyeonggiensis]MBB4099615.1 2'-5' RNA ligase [Sphingomonas kyeonggiensis]
MSEPALYVMIKPPPELRAPLCGCRSAHRLDAHYPPDRRHCTMLKLGLARNWAPHRLGRLREELGALYFDPFDVALDAIDRRALRGRKGMPAPAAFHRALRRAARRCGVELPVHNFWLHLSLAYKGMGVPRREIDPIGWRVEEFQLILSDHGHEVLGRWPLVQRQYALAL